MVVDVILVVLLLIFSIIGYYKGVLNQIFSFTAFIFALIFGPTLSKGIVNYLDLDSSNHYVVYMMALSIFTGIVVYFLVKFLFNLIEKIILGQNHILNNINKGLGAVLGFGKAFIIVLIIIFFFNTSSSEMISKLTLSSKITGLLERAVPYTLFERMQDGELLYFPDEDIANM